MTRAARQWAVMSHPGRMGARAGNSEVWMSRGERRVNAKSIMGVMMLAAGMGTDVVIETDGADEAPAMEALLALINDKFGEGE